MDFNINKVSGSVVSKFAFALMACCVVSYNISTKAHNGDVTTGAYALIVVAGITLLSWLIWFFYMYISGKRVDTMPRTPGLVTETINWIILILWILSDFVTIARHPLVGICAWCLLGVSVIYYATYCFKQGRTY